MPVGNTIIVIEEKRTTNLRNIINQRFHGKNIFEEERFYNSAAIYNYCKHSTKSRQS